MKFEKIIFEWPIQTEKLGLNGVPVPAPLPGLLEFTTTLQSDNPVTKI